MTWDRKQMMRDVVALVEHDMRGIIGRRTAGTLTIGEDDRGLKIEIEPPDTQAGRDVVTNVRLGNLDGMSFGFRTRKDSWDMGKTPMLRELLEVELFDVSVVAMPAYPKTEVALRSMDVARQAVEGARRRQLRLEAVEAELRR